jgi:diguanylate cyclase (GGDEF)-like protein
VAATIAVGVLLAALALVLESGLDDSRRLLEKRFVERAALTNTFVTSALDQSIEMRSTSAAQMLAGRRPGRADLERYVAAALGGEASEALLLDRRGRVLAAIPPRALRAPAALRLRPELQAALSGRTYSGSVEPTKDGPAVGLAAPFDTAFGRRVVEDLAPARGFDELFDAYLADAPTVRGGRVHIIDAGGHVIASSTRLHIGERLPDADLLGAVGSAPSGSYSEGGRLAFVSMRVSRSTWRLVVTAPRHELFAPVEARRVWALFGVIALLLLGGLALLLYVLERRRRRAVALERDRVDAEVAYLRGHDPLTGLPNRDRLRERVGAMLAGLAEEPGAVALLSLDIDRFSVVNDSAGHDAGDGVLVELAERIKPALQPGDTFARLGGDEFALARRGVEDAEAVHLATLVDSVMERPFGVAGHEVRLSATAGIAIAAGPRTSPDALIRNADVAMHRAKGRRAAFEVYDPDVHSGVVEQLELESALAGAVERGEMRLVYQPIVSVETGEVVELEALLRWRHPERGTIGPVHFMDLAEETGSIVPIGDWVVEEACRQIAGCREAIGRADLRIAVNASQRQLEAPGFVDAVAHALRLSALEPAALCVEVTETAIMRDPEAALRTLTRLKALGVRIAIDDFGVGYSSLGQLGKLVPVDVVKIDRSFVAAIDNHREAALVRAVVSMADALDLVVVAEGVETTMHVTHVRRLGCDLAQGYFFARPEPLEELERALRRPPARQPR